MPTIRVSIFVIRPIAKIVVDAMHSIGITDYQLGAGRSLILEEKSESGLWARLFPGSDIVDDPLDIIQFLIPPEKEEGVLCHIAEKAQLMLNGRGSIYSEEIDIPKTNENCIVNQVTDIPQGNSSAMLKEITGVCCIVQRGQGEMIAKTALETGVGSPNITFGTGTGVRDKMGLLRITIPAEKELVWMATRHFDADMLMDTMIEAGQLDQPGKGFIYLFPLRRGVLNMQVTRGVQRATASVEQIVAALDHLQGGGEWRRRADSESSKNRVYLRDLIDFTLVCDEGGGPDFVSLAMGVGAAGATISKLKQVSPDGSAGAKLSKARETCNMIVSTDVCEKILKTLEDADAFGDKYHGQVLTRKTSKAFTYLGGPKK